MSSAGRGSRSSNEVDELTSTLRSLNLRNSAFTPQVGGRPYRPFLDPVTRPMIEAVAPVPARTPVPEKRVDDYVRGIVERVIPSQSEMNTKRNLSTKLESIVQKFLPRTKLVVMGGAANNFALKNSDIDICIVEPNSTVEPDTWSLRRLETEFRSAGKPLFVIYISAVENWKST